MAQAKTLNEAQLAKVLAHIGAKSSDPLRDRAAVLLSFRTGLRSLEIAGLSWRNVLDAEGAVADAVEIPKGIAKKGSGGVVPMHPDLKDVLQDMLLALPAELTKPNQPIVRGSYGKPRMAANSVQKLLAGIYTACGFIGVSSHSGRRTFGTRLARMANEYNCSLYDVQDLLRHANIATTERYVEPSDGVGAMVRGL